jgi:aminopeptidase-like protein
VERSAVTQLLQELFPICRSITGNGVRKTLNILKGIADFNLFEVPSGTPCYDWIVPDEWNARDAYIADEQGNRIIDFQKNNLHLMSYSIPVDGTFKLVDLLQHLHTCPENENSIPYRTSYYRRDWGFCLSMKQFRTLRPWVNYHVKIDTTLKSGQLSYGIGQLPGTSGKEYLLSTYCCHPSMANDNLSGMLLWAMLLQWLQSRPHRHAYRFVIAPETIGALVYISQHEEEVKKLSGGYVITCVAGPCSLSYKSSFRGDAEIDNAAVMALGNSPWKWHQFDANGSDERQYSSPGLRIPMGSICKDKYYEYPEYHTSLDNLDFIGADALLETLEVYKRAIDILEWNKTYTRTQPIGEPMLSKYGLNNGIGGAFLPNNDELSAIKWVLFHADGKTPLLDVSSKTNIPMKALANAADKLEKVGLIKENV